MLKLLRCGILLSFITCAASADPLHWQLNGVTLSDGGRVFGGFDYDVATNTYSNINVTTTPGSLVTTGNFYNVLAPAPSSNASSFNAASTTPVFTSATTELSLGFSPPLSAAGGAVNIAAFAGESLCNSATCSPLTTERTATGGSAIAVSTNAPKRWQLQGVVLSDGSQAFGSFVFDSNTGTYSSIAITTTAGIGAASVLPGTSYFNKNPSAGSATLVSGVSAATVVPGTTTVFSASFASSLTNSGGTVNITGASEGICSAANCGTSGNLRTAAIAGVVSTTFIENDSKVLPQIADGGGFITTIIYTNPTGAPISSRLTFWGNDGNLLPISLNGSAAASGHTVVVPGHSSVFLSTPGGTGPSSVGWALANNVANMGVIAAYRLQVPNVPQSEATVAGISGTSGFAMAFDETTGFDTGFALANVSGTDTVIENLYFYDTTGKLIFSDNSHTLPPHGHESFLFSARYGGSPIMGQRGEVRVYYGSPSTPTAPIEGLTGLGLRINPGLTFTSLQTFTAASQ